MLTQRETDEIGQIVQTLQGVADQLTMDGKASLAGVVAGARQALRGVLTKALNMQQVLMDTEAVLTAMTGPPDGDDPRQLS